MKTQIKLFFVNLFGIVRKGQVWEYTMYKKNPFIEPHIYWYEILEVKKEYVKFQRITITGKTIENIEFTEKKWFTINSKCIYEKNRTITF